ncbi:MAG: hypothetical protein Q8911_11440 [Bacillota bacterium]|nr:hypothetical protein [Bacillota bacterium]
MKMLISDKRLDQGVELLRQIHDVNEKDVLTPVELIATIPQFNAKLVNYHAK